MKMKQVAKRFTVLLGAAAMALTLVVTPAASMPVQAAETESMIQPLSDNIEYIYKRENGSIYKRLYNFSTGVWIGDWIYVCPDPSV